MQQLTASDAEPKGSLSLLRRLSPSQRRVIVFVSSGGGPADGRSALSPGSLDILTHVSRASEKLSSNCSTDGLMVVHRFFKRVE